MVRVIEQSILHSEYEKVYLFGGTRCSKIRLSEHDAITLELQNYVLAEFNICVASCSTSPRAQLVDQKFYAKEHLLCDCC